MLSAFKKTVSKNNENVRLDTTVYLCITFVAYDFLSLRSHFRHYLLNK